EGTPRQPRSTTGDRSFRFSSAPQLFQLAQDFVEIGRGGVTVAVPDQLKLSRQGGQRGVLRRAIADQPQVLARRAGAIWFPRAVLFEVRNAGPISQVNGIAPVLLLRPGARIGQPCSPASRGRSKGKDLARQQLFLRAAQAPDRPGQEQGCRGANHEVDEEPYQIKIRSCAKG